MKKYYHYSGPQTNLTPISINSDYNAIYDPFKPNIPKWSEQKPRVLNYILENFTQPTIPSDPKIIFVRFLVSDRIKHTTQNIADLKEFDQSLNFKRVYVFTDPEWETENFIPQEKIVCENDFYKRGWLGRAKTIRNPEELALKPQKEYFISFLGLEGNYIGSYPKELLKEYRAYFDQFPGTFYIYWRIERESIGMEIDRTFPLLDEMISRFER